MIFLTPYIYSPKEKIASQKNNPTNGRNFCKQNIQGIKSKTMCWTDKTNIYENSSTKNI
jgi:hypothetical protein